MPRRTRLGRWIEGTRRPMAAAVALLVIASSLPARAQGIVSPRSELPRPTPQYFRNGDALYRLDAAELPSALAALSRAPGFASARLARAIPVGDTRSEAPLDSRVEDVLAGFWPVEADELAKLESSSPAVFWRDELQVSWASDGIELTTVYTAGEDEIRVVAPFDARAPGSRVEVQVRDVQVEIETADLEAGTVPESVTRSLEQAFGRIEDRDRVVAAVAGFAGVLGSALGRTIEENSPDASKWSCVNCAGMIAGYGVSLMAVVAACGGAFAMPCLMAFLNLTGAKVAVLGTCAACFEWIEEQNLEKKKKKGTAPPKGDCPCIGEPMCDCD